MDENDSVFYDKKILLVTTKPGTDFIETISEAIEMSKTTGFPVSFEHNDSKLVVTKKSTLESVYDSWLIQREQGAKYEKPQEEIEFIQKQKNLNRLMDSVDTIDFSDLEKTVLFLKQIIDNSYRSGTSFDHKKIDRILRANGYSEKNNAGPINVFDKKEVGNWIVGQYLGDNIAIVNNPINEWIEIYVPSEIERGQKKPREM